MVFITLCLRPSVADEHHVKLDSARKELNYSLVGATKDPATVRELARQGWIVDSVSVQVGKGQQAYKAARACLQRWGHFQLGWASVDPSSGTAEGTVLAVTSNTLFLWQCNPLRIIYNTEQDRPKPTPKLQLSGQQLPPLQSFRFAHGCVEGHMLAGEEAFGVELRPDGTVWYDIMTFSKPVHPLAIGFFPLTRFFQKKFGSESARAVVAAVADAEAGAK